MPRGKRIPPDFGKYERIAGEIRSHLARWADRVVPLSIDEAALAVDLAGPADVAAWGTDVQASIREELRLPCSVGASPYASVAKIACDAAKPGGLKVVPAEETESFLRPLPVRAIPGIGPKSAERLEALGVRTVGELADADLERLRRVLGRFGDEVRELARGHPGPALSELPTEGGPRQRSIDRTLERDTRDPAELYRLIGAMAEELAGALAREGLRYQEVIVRLRWQDFTQTQRGVKLAAAREDAASLASEATRLAREVLERERAGPDRAVRRVSLAAERLVPRRGRQPSLDQYGAEPASR